MTVRVVTAKSFLRENRSHKKFSARAEVTLEVLDVQAFLSSSSGATVSADSGDGSEESLTTNLTPAAPVRLSQMDITKRCHGLV